MSYLLFLLVLWPVMGWTAEQWPLCAQVSQIDSWYMETVRCDGPPIHTDSQNVRNLKDTLDCLATMEAAMKAMDDYIFKPHGTDYSSRMFDTKKYEAVYQLWSEAKRCWKVQP